MIKTPLIRALKGQGLKAASEYHEGSEAQVAAARAATANVLVEEHLWLVDRILSRTAAGFPSHVDRADLWAAGVLGLVEASQRFDPAHGVPFDRFASARVRGEILEATRLRDLAPRRLRRSLRELSTAQQTLSAQLGRAPEVEELAWHMGRDVESVTALLVDAARTADAVSLDAPARGDDQGSEGAGAALPELGAGPAEQLEDSEMLGSIREAVEHLPSPLLEIVVRSYWDGDRLADIAADMGVTTQRVAQYRQEAIVALTAWFSRLYEEITPPAESAPGRARRMAFCSEMAARSTWRSRLTRDAAKAAETA